MVQEPNKQPEGLKLAEVAEKPETQELITKRIDERQEKPLTEQTVEPATSLSPSPPPSPTEREGAISSLLKEPHVTVIESMLSDGLGDLYRGMNSQAQDKFRGEGEQVASKIQEMIVRAKLTARKVARLIRSWLRLIPGVSQFFLEQETKIKTDRIIEYSEKR